jgi:hypothetical protein
MDQQEQPRGRPTRRQLQWAGATAGLLTIVILIGYRYDITLWDWIKLLVVPAAIGGVGLWFNRQQQERQREAENERTRADVLQACLDKIGQLLLDKDRPLSQAVKGDEASTLARSLTLTALSQLDGRPKGTLIEFLSEAELIQGDPRIVRAGTHGERRDVRGPAIELTSADLSGMVLTSDDADLTYVMLGEASLRRAYMRGANLSNAVLFNTDLSDADLSWADLSDAKGTNKEQLGQAKSLEGATMPDGEVYSEDWPKWLKDKENHNEPHR